MAIYRGIGGAGDSTTDATLTAVTEQATNAAASAVSASASASTASTHKDSALTYSTQAGVYASNALASSVTASGHKDVANAYATAAAASYDAFDDRYLGAKDTAPTTDNDGEALLVGSLYFDTVDDSMKVWNGTAWNDGYVSLSAALLIANNLDDLDDVATARTNLGLGTVATTDASAYATAAQGATADTATQPGDNVSTLTNDAGYLTSFTETDPVYIASSWYTTTNNSSNWDTAYGWGNHASAGYASASTAVVTTGSYADPSWLTSLATSKLSGSIDGGTY